MTSIPPSGSPNATPPAASPNGKPDGRILELLVCPVTRGQLQYNATRQELISRAARLAYPIREGIPVMVPEEARYLDDDPPKRRAGD
jgi:uncharacterized protein